MNRSNTQISSGKICIMSAVPITLWNFYRGLVERLITEYDEVSIISSDMPELYNFENQLKCTIFPIEISRQISPLKDLISICKLLCYLHRGKYNILHAHTPKGGLLGMLSSFVTHIPIRVYTVHGLPLETAAGLKRKLLWLAEWLSCKLATSVLAVSHSLRMRLLEEKLCVDEKVNVLGEGTACGIDLERFKRTKNYMALRQKTRLNMHIPNDAIVFGFVGRIVPDKGINSLIRAFKKLQQEIDNCYLLLVGEFENIRETLNPEIMTLMRNDNKILYNGEFASDILPFYTVMDVVVLPSKREGFGLVLLEAAAMKLPTIASRVTGCIDAVVDNVTGLLVDSDDEIQLAKAMLKLVKKPDLRKRMGEKGRERVRSVFNSKLLISKHMMLYNKLLTKGVAKNITFKGAI